MKEAEEDKRSLKFTVYPFCILWIQMLSKNHFWLQVKYDWAVL